MTPLIVFYYQFEGSRAAIVSPLNLEAYFQGLFWMPCNLLWLIRQVSSMCDLLIVL